MCCTGLLFPLPGSARNTYSIQNTPEGFSSPGSARNTYDIQDTPVGGVKLYYTGLLFSFTVQGTHTAFKTQQRVVVRL